MTRQDYLESDIKRIESILQRTNLTKTQREATERELKTAKIAAGSSPESVGIKVTSASRSRSAPKKKTEEKIYLVETDEGKVTVSEGVAKKIMREQERQEEMRQKTESFKSGFEKAKSAGVTGDIFPTTTIKSEDKVTSTSLISPRPDLLYETTARKATYELKRQETEKQFEQKNIFGKGIGYLVTASSPDVWKKMSEPISGKIINKDAKKHTFGKELVIETLTRKKIRGEDVSKGKLFTQQFTDVLRSPIGFQLTSGMQSQMLKYLTEPQTKTTISKSIYKTQDYGNQFEIYGKGRAKTTVDTRFRKLTRNVFKEGLEPKTYESTFLSTEQGIINMKRDQVLTKGVLSVDLKYGNKQDLFRGQFVRRAEVFDDYVRGAGIKSVGKIGKERATSSFLFESRELFKVSDEISFGKQSSIGVSRTMDSAGSYTKGIYRTFQAPPPSPDVSFRGGLKEFGKLKPFDMKGQITEIVTDLNPAKQLPIGSISKTSKISFKGLDVGGGLSKPALNKPSRLVPRELIDIGLEPVYDTTPDLGTESSYSSSLGSRTRGKQISLLEKSLGVSLSPDVGLSLKQSEISKSGLGLAQVSGQSTSLRSEYAPLTDLSLSPDVGWGYYGFKFSPLPTFKSSVGGGGGSFSFSSRKLFPQPRGYKPSIAGIFTGKKRKKKPKDRITSGIEIRLPL